MTPTTPRHPPPRTLEALQGVDELRDAPTGDPAPVRPQEGPPARAPDYARRVPPGCYDGAP